MDEFFDTTMDEETKETIRKKVHYFIATYIPKEHVGYKQAKSLFGEDLLQERRSTPIIFQSYYSFVDSIQNYLEDKIVKRRPLHFIAYFTTFAMDEETIQKRKKWVDEYVGNTCEHLEFYEVGEKLYGEKLRGVYTQIELSQTERAQFTHLVKSIRKYIEQRECGKEKDIINHLSRRRKNNFIDYIIPLSASLEEREEAYKKLAYFIKNYIREEEEGYKVAQFFYGNTLRENYCNRKISEREGSKFARFVANASTYITTEKFRRFPNYFTTYFTSIDMEEEERKQVEEQVYKILESLPKDTLYYQAGISMYGEDFRKRKNEKVSKEEKDRIYCLIHAVRGELHRRKTIENSNDQKEEMRRSKKQYFIDQFVSSIAEEEERKQIEDRVYGILKGISKDTDFYRAGVAFYGEDFRRNYTYIDCSSQYSQGLCTLVDKVKVQLEKEIKIENYFPYLTSAIENLERIENREEIINLVLTEFPAYFHQLIHSSYFSILFESLTKEEGELVYLKLLQQIDKKMTDAEISKITGFSIEEIEDYTIMTKEDSLNQVNQYIKRK